MTAIRTLFVHYSAPPVVGGVEAVIEAHARVFQAAGYAVTVAAGRGEASALPEGTGLVLIPEMDTQHPAILEISAGLEQGRIPPGFAPMRDRLTAALRPILRGFEVVIVHNIFTKHFNLPLTAALMRLLEEEGQHQRWLAWCHDLSWTSEHAREKIFPGRPWDLLRAYRPDLHYVTVSEQRRVELAGLLHCPPAEIEVVYNGVDPAGLWGLSAEALGLVRRLDLLSAGLILLLPVRVTRAKNIELAARTLAVLRDRGCNPRLVVTGPPDPHSDESQTYFQSLLELRRALNLERELRFVYEAGPEPGEPLLIDQPMVADLLRTSDLLFMPSHREGFGMPVLEAGLAGIPVIASRTIPAALEIGGPNVTLFDPDAPPEALARLILEVAEADPATRLRRQVRQNFTWERIFRRKIEPLLREKQP